MKLPKPHSRWLDTNGQTWILSHVDRSRDLPVFCLVREDNGDTRWHGQTELADRYVEVVEPAKLRDNLSRAERVAIRDTHTSEAFLEPKTLGWPIHDEAHAQHAISYMQMGRGHSDRYPFYIRRIRNRFPAERYPAVAERLGLLERALKAKAAGKPTTFGQLRAKDQLALPDPAARVSRALVAARANDSTPAVYTPPPPPLSFILSCLLYRVDLPPALARELDGVDVEVLPQQMAVRVSRSKTRSRAAVERLYIFRRGVGWMFEHAPGRWTRVP